MRHVPGQVLIDPHKRDAVCLPRRGEPLPDSHGTCTAYIVDVSRAADGLRYSVPVRFSRFERLHAELLAELPHLAPLMPALPPKRGPLDLGKINAVLQSVVHRAINAPGEPPMADDPAVVELRTRALDAYLRTLAELPGVATSAALMDVVALSASAEEAVRQALEAAATNDEARLTALSKLSRELAASSAYARTARTAKERAELRAASLDAALDATTRRLSHQRGESRMGRAFRSWHASARAGNAAKHAKAARATDAALALARGLVATKIAEGAAVRLELAGAEAALAEMEEEAERLRRVHAAELLAVQAAAAAQVAAAHDAAAASEAAAVTLEGERTQANARADVAAKAASAARAELRAAEVELAATRMAVDALKASLDEADGEIGELDRTVEAQLAGSSAMHAQLATERRRRVVLSLRASLEQRAAEARLLHVLHSQKEALDTAAAELAAVRRAAAVERSAPELEGPWLAPPPPPPNSAEAEAAMQREMALRREEVYAACRAEWIAAMMHSM